VKGTFRGTWETTGPRRLLAVPAAVAVLLAVLATVLWLLAVIGAVLLVLVVATVIVLRRGSRADRDAFAERTALFHVQAVGPPRAPEIHNHLHLHIGDGADAAVRQAIELYQEKS
jgi:hypothetical protein